jgi:hypothetical protein
MRDQAVVGEGGEQGTAERPAGQQGKRGGREGEQQPLAEHQATRLACRGTDRAQQRDLAAAQLHGQRQRARHDEDRDAGHQPP